MTNKERLLKLTNYQLASLLVNINDVPYPLCKIESLKFKSDKCDFMCKKCVAEWFGKEVEEQ